MNYLIPIDFSDATDKVIAAIEQHVTKKGSKITLLHVAEPDPAFVGYEAGPDVVRSQVAQEYKREHKEIQDLAQGLRDIGFDATGLLIQGPIVKTVLETAKKAKADMIIMGTHGRGAVFQILVGSVSEGVLHKAKCPVLLVPMKD